ncbi:MAG: hypothetical protein JXR91_13410 [Deltaproteobacteria bacterium]|nr:hypothetical protein [Deltaproteobacteria bacterium]
MFIKAIKNCGSVFNVFCFSFCFMLLGCGENSGEDSKADSGVNDNISPYNSDNPAPGVAEDCGSVRMTTYGASIVGWCGFDRTDAVLPDFVRAGMTVAIAEPYNGSTYGGEPGESCGECFELSTTFGHEIIMVHDLCPVEGNPICAGTYFHFDVSSEVAAAVDGGGWLGEAAVRRVPCPVNGNIYVHITARNQWGYLQLAFFNHRFPIRNVEYKAAGSENWQPMNRCLARWCQEDDKDTFGDGGPGGIFRITGANGEVVVAENILTYDVNEDSNFDTGIQFSDGEQPEGVCEFTPPGDVYDEGFGGIDSVRWESNTWGSTILKETDDSCADDSKYCLELENFKDSGLHLTYRHIFPVDTFNTIELTVKSTGGTGTVEVAPGTEDARCENPTTITVSKQWETYQINIQESCPGVTDLRGLTISHPSGDMNLMLDKIKFLNSK